jgi:hypothetical protein
MSPRRAFTLAGSLSWSWVDRKDELAANLLIQERVHAMRGDFENTVVQAILG